MIREVVGGLLLVAIVVWIVWDMHKLYSVRKDVEDERE